MKASQAIDIRNGATRVAEPGLSPRVPQWGKPWLFPESKSPADERVRWRKFGRMMILLAFLISVALLPAASGQEKQLLPNPSFEELKDGKPVGWRPVTYQPEASFEVDKIARTGSYSVRISSENGADASWSVQVKVRPFARYRLSGWVKTEEVESKGGKGVLINIHGLENFRPGLRPVPATGPGRKWLSKPS